MSDQSARIPRRPLGRQALRVCTGGGGARHEQSQHMERSWSMVGSLLLPLLIPIVAFGLSFGTLAAEAGFSPAAATIMSATTFAGGAQFAAIAVLLQGGNVLIAAAAACLLNMRFVPMGLAISPYLTGGPLSRLLHAQLIIDETWALSHRNDGTYSIDVLRRLGISLWFCWVSATLVGALFEASIDIVALGLDAALPAVFLALLVPRLRTKVHVAAAGGAATITLLLVPVVPPGIPILVGGVIAAVATQQRQRHAT